MSSKSKKRILRDLRDIKLHKKSQCTIQDLAILLNPKIREWINYYGKVRRDSLKPVFYYLHHRLIKWILNTYNRFKRSRVLAIKWLRWSYYWLSEYVLSLGFRLSINLRIWPHNKSRMSREVHVRFCERFRGEIPLYLLDLF